MTIHPPKQNRPPKVINLSIIWPLSMMMMIHHNHHYPIPHRETHQLAKSVQCSWLSGKYCQQGSLTSIHLKFMVMITIIVNHGQWPWLTIIVIIGHDHDSRLRLIIMKTLKISKKYENWAFYRVPPMSRPPPGRIVCWHEFEEKTVSKKHFQRA